MRSMPINPLAAICALVFVLGAFPSHTYANSGPIDNDGMPGAEGMVIDEDCPIVVQHENLTFDYRNYEWYSDINGMVTASYTMQNPTSETQKVEMAFPYICRRINLNVGHIGISVDDEYIPWQLYSALLPVDNQEASIQQQLSGGVDLALDFDSVLQLIQNDAGQPVDIMAPSAQGVLYEISDITDGFHIVFSETPAYDNRHYMTQGEFYYLNEECHLKSVDGAIRFFSTVNIYPSA